MKLFNSATRKIEDLTPIEPGKIKLYTCGPTVYDHPHIGNWTANIYWDILVRTLRQNDLDVERVMNITDVGHLTSDADEGEDKLEKGARRENKTAWQVAKIYTDSFMEGMDQLNMTRPTHIAKATDFIAEQLGLVRTLKEKGYTYQTSDGIYFDTSKFPRYREFARLDIEGLRAGARVSRSTEKKNSSDFALWKFTPLGSKRDMEWETPSDLLEKNAPVATEDPTMGFPGWHLECSAMALDILGETLDIHTGGIDHIPVHHTNEIAQSEAATDKTFANIWLHSNHLKVNGVKISKSLGNGYTLRDLEQKGFSPLDFRLFVLQSHYSTESNFTFENLAAASSRLKKWKNAAAIRWQIYKTVDSANEDQIIDFRATSQALVEAASNNLDTPAALRLIDEAFSRITPLGINKIHRNSLVTLLQTIDDLLGLKLIDSTPDVSDEIKELILQRNAARENQDWQQSDKIRNQLTGSGIMLHDSGPRTIWEYID